MDNVRKTLLAFCYLCLHSCFWANQICIGYAKAYFPVLASHSYTMRKAIPPGFALTRRQAFTGFGAACAQVPYLHLRYQPMRLLSYFLLLLTFASSAFASEPLTQLNIVLLQPSSVLEERVPNIDAMAEYIKAIQAASRAAVIESEAKQATGGYIVVAVRPGQQSKVWLDFDTMLDLQLRKQIITKVSALKPFEASKGPVVFALKVALWNGKEPKRNAPLPPEWRNVNRNGGPMEIGELVESIWGERP